MNVICRFATAIGYPQTVPAERQEFTFIVDGGEMRALDLGNRLVLTREISREEDDVPRLAAYAPGRILREDAALYWDGYCGAVKLAQEIPADATGNELKVFFETFADSCDWWLSRAAAELVELQYEVHNLAFQQEVVAKVADKSSSAIQTLVRNQ